MTQKEEFIVQISKIFKQFGFAEESNGNLIIKVETTILNRSELQALFNVGSFYIRFEDRKTNIIYNFDHD